MTCPRDGTLVVHYLISGSASLHQVRGQLRQQSRRIRGNLALRTCSSLHSLYANPADTLVVLDLKQLCCYQLTTLSIPTNSFASTSLLCQRYRKVTLHHSANSFL